MNNTFKKLAIFTASLACITLTACNSGANDQADFEAASKKLIYDQIAYPGVIGDFDLTQSIAGYDFKIKYSVTCADGDDYLKISDDNTYCKVNAPTESQTTKEYITGVLSASFTKNDKEIGKKDYNVRVNKIGNLTNISEVHTYDGTKWSYTSGKTYTFKGKVTCSGGKETDPYSFWIDDGTGAFYAYKADTKVEAGWTVIVQCSLTTYYGQLESENYANVAIISKNVDKVAPVVIDTDDKFNQLSIDNFGTLFTFSNATLKSGSILEAKMVDDVVKFVNRSGELIEATDEALNFTVSGKTISMQIPLGYITNFFDDYCALYTAYKTVTYGDKVALSTIYTLKAYSEPEAHDKTCAAFYYAQGSSFVKAS